MTEQEQLVEMLKNARLNYSTRNGAADVIVNGAVFRFTPLGALENVFSEDEDSW